MSNTKYTWGSDGVSFKLLACRVGGQGSIPGLTTTISEIGYLLLPSRDMAEISFIDVNPQNNQPTNHMHYRSVSYNTSQVLHFRALSKPIACRDPYNPLTFAWLQCAKTQHVLADVT